MSRRQAHEGHREGRAPPGKQYPIDEALKLVKEFAAAQVQRVGGRRRSTSASTPRKSDQSVRGSTVMPNGIGKTVRVAVFAQGAQRRGARKAAGADIVGLEDLAEKMKAGEIEFRRGDRHARMRCAWSASSARSSVPAA